MKHYPHTFSGRKASQSEFELLSFIGLLKKHNVTRYLEIGVRDADTFHEVVINLPKGSTAVAVDLPGGLWGKKSTVNNAKKACEDLAKRGYNVELILGNSTSSPIIQTIYKYEKFDAALIDGDHTLVGVTADYLNFKSIAPIIAFHDIVGTGQKESVQNHEVEVPILWNELKAKYGHLEFIDKDSKMGIGCIFQ